MGDPADDESENMMDEPMTQERREKLWRHESIGVPARSWTISPTTNVSTEIATSRACSHSVPTRGRGVSRFPAQGPYG